MIDRDILKNDYHGRLQRSPNATGMRITRFREVLYRHGLPVGILALICLMVPQMKTSLKWGLERFLKTPLPYFLAAFGLMLFFVVSTVAAKRRLDARQILWIFYLMGISMGEEWVFRLAVPGFSAGYIGLIPSIVLCNVVFAGMHYFTLRWKLRWCVVTFFGAMGLSRLMGNGDLMLVIGVHWIATFLNTPVPVGSKVFRIKGLDQQNP